jgi:3-oxoadipate enol-lactonase
MESFSKCGFYWKCTPGFDVSKPTLVFLHAAWMPSTMFAETVVHLQALLPETNLLCVDLNGHGKTTAGRKCFTLWDQGDDVVALMVCL